MEFSKARQKQIVAAWLSGDILSSTDLPKLRMWTYPEKQAFEKRHEAVIESLRPPARNSSGPFDRLLIVVGGAPLSGKSVVNSLLLSQLQLEDKCVRISPEKIRAAFPEYYLFRSIGKDKEIIRELRLQQYQIDQMTQQSHDFVAHEINDIVQEAIETFAAEGLPIILESHMNNPHAIAANLQAARACGYETLLIAPDIDVPTFFQRGEARLQATGKRFLPISALGRQALFEVYWPEYAREFNVAARVNNNGRTLSPIAVSVEGVVKVFDAAAYDRSRQKREIQVWGDTPEEALAYREFSPDNIREVTASLASNREPAGTAWDCLCKLFPEMNMNP